MTCLIATAEVLANKTESWQGTVFICAQPAEEAPQMCEFLPNMIYSLVQDSSVDFNLISDREITW